MVRQSRLHMLTTLPTDHIWRGQHGSELMAVRFQLVNHLEIGDEATSPLTTCVLSPFLEL